MPSYQFDFETYRFYAKGSDGKQYTVVELTTYSKVETELPESKIKIITGQKAYKTWPDHRPVTRVSGQLVIPGTTIVLSPE